MKMDSIIFDLDGTLWDSTEAIQKALNNELKGISEIQKYVTREEVKSVMGLQIIDIAKKMFPYLNEDLQIKVADSFTRTHCDYVKKYGGELYKDLEETLKILSKKYSLFIVSNCQCGYIEAFLDYSKLGSYFKGYESSGNTGLPKKDNIKIIMQRYSLKSPVYVGDTQLDCESAEGAGIPFIFASYGFGNVENYKYIIKSISDLTKFVEI